jgi:hypothetical protein
MSRPPQRQDATSVVRGSETIQSSKAEMSMDRWFVGLVWYNA